MRIKTLEKEEPEDLVVCYNCGKSVPAKEAFYISYWDCYYCPQCYLKLLNGGSVRYPGRAKA